MASPSPSGAGWRCTICSIFAGSEYLDPPTPTTQCSVCHVTANPCLVLRREVGELRHEISALRASSAVPVDPTTPPVAETMDAKAAAEFLKLPSVKALYAAVQRAQVPALRFGRRLRFSRSALEELMRKVA